MSKRSAPASTRRPDRAHGADATRYGLLKMSSTQDVRFSHGRSRRGGSSRTSSGTRAGCSDGRRVEPEAGPHGRGALDPRAHRCDPRRAGGDLAAFEFAHAVERLYHLTFDDFCDWYLEAIKPRLDGGGRASDGLRRARAAAQAAPSGHAARDGGDLDEPARARDAADRRAVAGAAEWEGEFGPIEGAQTAARIFRRSGVRIESRETRCGFSRRSCGPAAKVRATSMPSGRASRRKSTALSACSPTGSSSPTPPPNRRGQLDNSSAAVAELDALGRVLWIPGRRRLRARADARRLAGLGDPQARSRRPRRRRRASRRRRAQSRRPCSTTGARPPPTSRPRPRLDREDRVGGQEADIEAAGARAAGGGGARGDAVRGPDGGALPAFAGPGSRPPASRRASAAGSTRPAFSRNARRRVTGVGLDHTEVLGETREAIAAEKLAVVEPGSTVVLAEPERGSPRRTARTPSSSTGGRQPPVAVAAAELFLGRPADPHAADECSRDASSGAATTVEILDGAHNLQEAAALPRLPASQWMDRRLLDLRKATRPDARGAGA